MTDTTEQQAVTVAQEDHAAAYDLAEAMDGRSAGECLATVIPQAFARHRLASVSSASAEGVEHGDIVTIAYMMGAKAERDRRAASPEPVPATNQAGEALTLLRTMVAHFGAHGVPPEVGEHYRAADRILATQPATSQEGGDGFEALHQAVRSIGAATPTPPTLSEDLREALARELASERNASDEAQHDACGTTPWDGTDDDYMAEALVFVDRCAALARAQVKAS